MALTYHPNALLAADLPSGFTEVELSQNQNKREAAYRAVQEQKRRAELGFAKLPYAETVVGTVQRCAEPLLSECADVVVIGIGGSDLGARAVHRALNHQFYNYQAELRGAHPRLFFAGDTTDPQALQEIIAVVDWARAGLIMISKSGNTVEQMATFVVLRDTLLKAVSKEVAQKRIVTVTDATSGTLRAITNDEGYASLPIPNDVGGRFSVLSSVGLLPLAVAGIDIAGLLAGARELDQQEAAEPSFMADYAFHQYLASTLRGWHINVLFPYTYSLREVGFWFRQLWAESLGKKVNRAGDEVHTGPTPIAALGPTDQHSQAQLYMEGPRDKIITFVTVQQVAHDLTIPESFPQHEGAHYLTGISLQRILLAEQKATAQALVAADRPSGELVLDQLDAYHLGQLLYFFELATAYYGELAGIDAYDQPGVELGKQLMYRDLGRPGY